MDDTTQHAAAITYGTCWRCRDVILRVGHNDWVHADDLKPRKVINGRVHRAGPAVAAA